MKVIELPTLQRQAEADVVALLEDVLADAKAGRVIGVAIVAALPDRGSWTMASKTDCFHTLLGGLDLLKYRMLVEHTTQEG